jgi:hypothetical protein
MLDADEDNAAAALEDAAVETTPFIGEPPLEGLNNRKKSPYQSRHHHLERQNLPCRRRCRTILSMRARSLRQWILADFQEPRLHQEIPNFARFVDIDLDEVSRLSPAQLATTPCILPHKCFLDDQVRLGQDTQCCAEHLFRRGEEMQGGAVGKVEGC